MSKQLREECDLMLIEAGESIAEESQSQSRAETKTKTVLGRVLNCYKSIGLPNEDKESLFENAANSWSFLVSESEDFFHKENPDHILKERDESLGRDIIILKGVCWLCFRKRLGLHSPGRYRVRLRLYVDENTSWPRYPGSPSTMSVHKIEVSDAGEIINRSAIVNESFPPTAWSEIASGTFQGKQKVITDETSENWHFFYLDPFEIQSEEKLEFEFQDISDNWKSGMKWDLIELYLLDSFHSSK